MTGALIVTSLLAAAQPHPVGREPFGKLPDGTAIERFTLTNKNGVTVKITNYGAKIEQILVPAKQWASMPGRARSMN